MTRTKNTFAFTATSTTATQTVQESGFIQMVNVDVPNFTNAITVTVSILDTDDYVLWTKTTIAKNAVTRVDALSTPALGSVPVDYGYKIKVDLSGAAGGDGGSVKVMAYINPQGAIK